MSRIAIIDDDVLFSDLLKLKVEELYPTWNLTCFSEMPKEPFTFDACFLDIELKGVHKGFEIANAIKEKDADFPIIFISSHDELVCEGYKYSALRFMRKHCYQDELAEALVALDRVIKFRKTYVDVKDDKTNIPCRILFNAVQYIYSSGNYVYFLDNENQIFRRRSSMKRFLEEYPINFVKSGSGEYLNPIYIQTIDSRRSEAILQSGRIVQISKRNLNSVIRYFTLTNR